jgi:hypothetical protein
MKRPTNPPPATDKELAALVKVGEHVAERMPIAAIARRVHVKAVRIEQLQKLYPGLWYECKWQGFMLHCARTRSPLSPLLDGVIAFYNPVDENDPLELLEREFVPATLQDAKTLVRLYNDRAFKNPRLYKLLGIFPKSALRRRAKSKG